MLCLCSPLAQAETAALTVEVQIGDKTAPVAAYTLSELQGLPQTLNEYSSLDATSTPVVIAAQGVTINGLLRALNIPAADLTEMQLKASDGWNRNFSAADYLQTDRYYYAGIVSGYDPDAAGKVDFAPGTEETKQPVETMLALKSYEGRMQVSPASQKMSAGDGIRFCFGQTTLTDNVMLNYGKNINKITLVLKDSTAYTPPAQVIGRGESTATTPNPGVKEEIRVEGLAADTLTITVGYYGGTYYTKKVFTLEDLEAMSQVRQVYSYIDNMPAVCLDSAVGVRLTDIMKAAGIDVNSIQAFNFYCADISRTWYTSVTKDYLLDTMRFYYPNLPTHWDYDEAAATPGAADGSVSVDTIIAWEDNWRRFATEPGFDNLTETTRFRLIFGQTDVVTPTSSRSAKWIHTIAVTLGGTPPAGITLDASALDLEVGSQVQLNATLKITENTTDQRVEWTSSDPDTVSVDQHGRIKVLAEGRAVVTATTVVGGLSASAVINGGGQKPETETATAAGPTDGQESKEATKPEEQTPDVGTVYEIGGENQAVSPDTPAVQNWRVYEMSETATALTEIDQGPNPLALPTAVAVIVLFGSGAVVRTITFFKQL